MSSPSLPHISDVPFQEDALLQHMLRRYASRFLLLSATALVLLGVVVYQYNTKVGAPIEAMATDVQTQLVTEPQQSATLVVESKTQ